MDKPRKGVNQTKGSGEKNQCSQYKWFRHLQDKKLMVIMKFTIA